MDKLYKMFPDFVFDEDENLFLDLTQDANSLTQSSY